MERFDLYEKSEKTQVVALGLFDSVHPGHVAVFSRAVSLAKKMGVAPAAFTLTGSVKGDNLYTEAERFRFMEKAGISACITAPFSEEIKALSGEEFFKILVQNHGVRAVVSGQDYRFGRGAECTVSDLRRFAQRYGVRCELLSDVTYGEEKISTGRIKQALREGNIPLATALLGRPYGVSGRVVKGREVGRTLGFPTANVYPESASFIKQGVYAAACIVEGKPYACVANFGSAPTFGCESVLLETHLIGFTGDLYGKTLRVYFVKYLRDIQPFFNAEALSLQLKQDKKAATAAVSAEFLIKLTEMEE